jgi:hypothetical protein
VSRCDGCQAEIEWARTPDGQRMPLDKAPDPKGNIVIRDRYFAVTLTPIELLAPPQPGEVRRVSHFATCPKAAEFRKRGRR